MNTPHTRMASRQCECAYDASNGQLWCRHTHTYHMQTVARQCECACEPSGSQFWCTCTHTYHTQTVARQCASSHESHSLISSDSDMSMLSSSTYARPPRVRCEEGREQTRVQRHLRGNINKRTPPASVQFSSNCKRMLPSATTCMPCPAPWPHYVHAHNDAMPIADSLPACVTRLRMR